MSKNLTENAAALKWEQCIDLGRGLITPGTEKIETGDLERRYRLPIDMRGQLVVDFRSRDGLLAVACLQRGAQAVVAIDAEARPTLEFVRESLCYSPTQLHFKKHEVEEPLKFQGDWVLCFDAINRSERPMEVIRNAVRTARRWVVIECEVLRPKDGADLDIRWEKGAGPAWLPTMDAVVDALKIYGCPRVEVVWTAPQGLRASFLGVK